jgi:hypothetical protein
MPFDSMGLCITGRPLIFLHFPFNEKWSQMAWHLGCAFARPSELRNEGWTCFALIALILHMTILILVALHTASVCTLSSTCDTWNVRLGCLAGCKNCANTAPDTFAIEEDFGRARVVSQSGNPAQAQSAIETWFWASPQPFYLCWDFCLWRVEIMVIRFHFHCMRNTAIDSFKDSPGGQHAKHSRCWQGVSESCSPVDCIHRVTAAQLTLLEDEMRRIERVNVCPLFLTLPVRNNLNILVCLQQYTSMGPRYFLELKDSEDVACIFQYVCLRCRILDSLLETAFKVNYADILICWINHAHCWQLVLRRFSLVMNRWAWCYQAWATDLLMSSPRWMINPTISLSLWHTPEVWSWE